MKKFVSLLMTVLMFATMLTVFAVPASAETTVENPLCLTSTGITKIGFDTIPDSSGYKLEYSLNGGEWTQANESTEINLNDKDSVCFRANGSSETLNVFVHLSFKMSGTGTVAASGNAMSLLKDGKCCAYCFANLFCNCTVLTAAPELPATTLAPGCYGSMFKGCTALKLVPALPATILADSCYSSMFCGCTALKAAPTLPATKLTDSCYSAMFEGCTALKAAPTLLATETANSCYNNMFKDCTSLKITAEQPKTGHYSELRFPNTDCLRHTSGDTIVEDVFINIPGLPYIEANTTYYSPHSSESETEYEATIETITWKKEICADCGKVLSRTEVGRDVTVTKTTAPYQPDTDTNPAVGSVLSEGSLTIIVGIAAAVVFGLGGFFLGRKKKKTAVADGE